LRTAAPADSALGASADIWKYRKRFSRQQGGFAVRVPRVYDETNLNGLRVSSDNPVFCEIAEGCSIIIYMDKNAILVALAESDTVKFGRQSFSEQSIPAEGIFERVGPRIGSK